MPKTTTVIQLRVRSLDLSGDETKLNSTQQKAIDTLVNNRVGSLLHDLSYEVSTLIDNLMEIKEQKE